MDPLQRQAEWLSSQGLETVVLRAALAAARAEGGDLLAALVQLGTLRPDQAEALRARARAESERVRVLTPTPSSSGDMGASDAGAGRPSDSALVRVSRSDSDLRGSDSRPADSSIDEIPGFHLGAVLGEGGMGRVQLARDIGSGAEVVIKRLLGVAEDEAVLIRFEREARALAAVNHWHIVKVHRFGEAESGPFLVMERIHGRSLQELGDEAQREGEWLDEERLRGWFVALAEALEALHAAGIVHRDLKPENLMIEDDTDRLVLVDLGLARRIDSRSEVLTRTGQVVGTPRYMAPEQLSGADFGPIGPATDVWGFAGSLFFALTGRAPIDGSSFIAVSAALVAGQLPQVSDHRSRADPLLASVCEAGLQRRPRDRATLAELHAALVKGRRPGMRPGRRRRIIAAAGALGIGCLGLLFGLALRDTTPPVLELETAGPIVTRERRVTITGRVIDGHPFEVQAGDERASCRSDGRFRLRFELEEGRHFVKLVAIDGAGLSSAPVSIPVIIDRTPPTLELRCTGRDARERYRIEGRASEEGCRVQLGDAEVPVKSQRIELTLAGSRVEEKPSFRITDRAGNETVVPLPIRVVGPGRALSELIKEAAAGDLIVLPPGRHRLQLGGSPQLTLFGSGRGVTTVVSVGALTLFEMEGGRLRFEQLSIEGPDGQARLGTVKDGLLEMVDCDVRTRGTGIFLVGESGAEGVRRPRLIVRGCRLESSNPVLSISGGRLEAERCDISAASGRPTDDASLVEVLAGSEAELVACDLGQTSQCALQVQLAEATLELCEISKCLTRATNASWSGLTVLGCSIHDNGAEAVNGDSSSELLVAASDFARNSRSEMAPYRGMRCTGGSIGVALSIDFEPASAAITASFGGWIRAGRIPGARRRNFYPDLRALIETRGETHKRTRPSWPVSKSAGRSLQQWIRRLDQPKMRRRAISAIRSRRRELTGPQRAEIYRRGLTEYDGPYHRLLQAIAPDPGMFGAALEFAARDRLQANSPIFDAIVSSPWRRSDLQRAWTLLAKSGLVNMLLSMKGPTTPSSGPALLQAARTPELEPGILCGIGDALATAGAFPDRAAECLKVARGLGPMGRREIGLALLRSGFAADLAAAVELLEGDEDPVLQRALARRLLVAGPGALEVAGRLATEAPKTPERDLRRAALLSLAALDSEAMAARLADAPKALRARAEEILLQALEDPDTGIRRRAILLATRKVATPAMIQAVLARAEAEDPTERQAVAVAAPWLADSAPVRTVLERLSGDSDARVQRSAKAAVARLNRWRERGETVHSAPPK